MSNLILLFFFLPLFFLSSTSSSSSSSSSVNSTHKCSVQQSLALLLFKQNLSSINHTLYMYDYTPCEDWLGSGYNPVMMNWNTSTDCCDWNGVTCDHSTGDVIGLDLSCGMLQGTIHPNTTLFDLPRLQRLNLACNNFTGSQLAPAIGRVSTNLTHLNISRCGFTGQVPTYISQLHKLVSLDLSDNYGIKLEPQVFINLLQNSTVMQELSLAGVNIFSILPTYLNISSSLRLLNLAYTGLQGQPPHSFFNHQSFEKLDLSYNSFTGHVPLEILHLPKLVSLDLSRSRRGLVIQPHLLSILLINSTFLRELWLEEVDISSALPTYLNISSSLRSLDLSYTRLQGKLPDNILNLKYLEFLDLSGNNNLSGPLPEVNTSSSMPLKELALLGTSLSGEIPISIGHLKSLVSLFLSNCGLNGPLPKSLGNLRYLENLYLSYNMLSGILPSPLFTLTSLQDIRLDNNMFQGNIPLEFFSLQSLVRLSLANNQLTGQIDVLDNGPLPKSLGDISKLESLDLSSNKLSGTMSSSLFTVPSLQEIRLNNNMFRGSIPLELFSLQSLKKLSLANNQLTGQIDVLGTFQRLTNLTKLDLSYNNFRGDWELDALLSSLTNLDTLILSYSGISVRTSNAKHYVNPEFMILSLASCSLKVFPVSFKAMTNLMHLDLSNNDIQGHIPDWVGEIGRNQLFVLNLANNSITGTIPNVYKDWSWLEGFILNGNQLEGKVPTSLYECQNLRIIDLGNNQLSGTFPEWLGDLPNLQTLVLKSNAFHGGIVTPSSFNLPFQSLRVLDLSHNGFVGQLPTKYLQNFNAMKYVVKNNKKPEYVLLGVGLRYYYTISIVVKGVDRYFPRLSVVYTIIDLSGNKFEGEIPNIIGSLKSLKSLNLSHNSLTSRIPHALGNMSEIESLDLSSNQLTGEIPQSLVDLTFLAILNLSQNHLMGRIPQGKQFNTFDGYSFSGNPKLCGLPLPKKCSLHKPQPEGNEDEEEDRFTWKVVVMGYGCGSLLGIVLGYLMLSTGRPKWFSATANAAEHMILTRQNKRR